MLLDAHAITIKLNLNKTQPPRKNKKKTYISDTNKRTKNNQTITNTFYPKSKHKSKQGKKKKKKRKNINKIKTIKQYVYMRKSNQF